MTALTARARGQLAWGGVDQGVSSATNFGLSVLAGRLLGTEGLGVVFLGFSIYLLALSFVRGLIMEPFVVATAALPQKEQQDATRACTILVAAAGATTSVLMAIGGLVLADPIGRSLVIFAPWVGIAILQDHWRSVLFRDRRARAAAFNDGMWALGMVAMIPVALTFQQDWVIAATWGVGAGIGALVGGWQIKLRPSGPLHAFAWWRRELRYLGSWLAVQNVVFSAASQLTIVLIAGQLGADDLGGIRAVDVVFAPMTMVGDAFSFPGVPIVVRALAKSARDARRWAWRLSGGAAFLVGGYLVLAIPFSRQILTHLFGPEFAVFTAIVIPIALGQLARAAATGFSILLKADRRVHAITVSRGVTNGLKLVLGTTLAAHFGLVPAVWGMEVGVTIGAIVTVVLGLMARDVPLPRRAPRSTQRPASIPISVD